jgi:hypothetical protein
VSDSSENRQARPSVGDAKSLVRRASELRGQIGYTLESPRAWRVTARQAYDRAVEAMVAEQLLAMPIGRIRETTEGRLRLGPIEAAGYRTVGQAAAAGPRRLEAIPGVGGHTATQVVAAAHQLRTAMTKATRLHFDPDRQPSQHTALLGALCAYEGAEQVVSPIREGITGLAGELDAILEDARSDAVSHRHPDGEPRRRVQDVDRSPPTRRRATRSDRRRPLGS